MNSTRPPLIRGPWTLADYRSGKIGSPKNGLKVFSCFHCGGGSTMGYKLAGFEVLGGVEIDPEMIAIYRANHHPKHSYLMGVQEFKTIPDADLPRELFEIDVLDGSPPCSSFSMSGARERGWGEEKKFREGQAVQVLDDLFFHFIDIAKKLQPKVVVAENVKGLIQGNARGYVKEIFSAFASAGYDSQLFLLNASKMGVPQARERTFFVARRRNLGLRKLDFDFDEAPISVGAALKDLRDQTGKPLSNTMAKIWKWCGENSTPDFAKFGEQFTGKRKYFNHRRLRSDSPSDTQTATTSLCHPVWPRYLSPAEAVRIQSFPDDFNFGKNEASYVCGMSVPPLMMQRVADQISRQWFSI